jgi:hypothetical protein
MFYNRLNYTCVNATTLDIGDNKIVVNAGGSTTHAGIIANVSGTEHEFVYSTNNNAWGTTGNLNIGGNVIGTTFIGNLIGAIKSSGTINTARINLKDYSEDSTEYCSISSSKFGFNGGQLEFHVKDSGCSLTERLIIEPNVIVVKTDGLGLSITSQDGLT